jgi:hypothetical protein
MRTLLRPLALMLPALVPSWRFFDVIAPSPRIHFRLMNKDSVIQDWQEFNPRPAHVSVFAMFARMPWNARWNEQLFVMSCAERILAGSNDQGKFDIAREIAMRVANNVAIQIAPNATQLQLQIMLAQRVGDAIQVREAFVSRAFNLREISG